MRLMRQRGLGLVQLMVVVTVIAMLSISVVSNALSNIATEKYEGVHKEVSRLHKAVETYYHANCNSGNVVEPTLNQLASLNLLSHELVLPPGAALDAITIDQVVEPAVFYYVLSFASKEAAFIAGQSSSAATVNNTYVTWAFPGHRADITSLRVNQYLDAFGISSC